MAVLAVIVLLGALAPLARAISAFDRPVRLPMPGGLSGSGSGGSSGGGGGR